MISSQAISTAFTGTRRGGFWAAIAASRSFHSLHRAKGHSWRVRSPSGTWSWCRMLGPCLARGTAAVAPGQRCACLQPVARGVRVPQAGTSGGGQVQTLRPAEEVIWGPAVEKLSVCD